MVALEDHQRYLLCLYKLLSQSIVNISLFLLLMALQVKSVDHQMITQSDHQISRIHPVRTINVSLISWHHVAVEIWTNHPTSPIQVFLLMAAKKTTSTPLSMN